MQLPGSQLGVFPVATVGFTGRQERAMCCVVENYQEEDGVRVRDLQYKRELVKRESKVHVKTKTDVI